MAGLGPLEFNIALPQRQVPIPSSMIPNGRLIDWSSCKADRPYLTSTALFSAEMPPWISPVTENVCLPLLCLGGTILPI
jgi:hypothetical protein